MENNTANSTENGNYAESSHIPSGMNVYMETAFRQPSYSMTYEHRHKYYELYCLHSGYCIYKINGVCSTLEAGSFILIPPSMMHTSSYPGKDVSKRTLVFFMPEVVEKSGLTDLNGFNDFISTPGSIRFSPTYARAADDLLNMLADEFLYSSGYSPLLLSRYVTTLLSLLFCHGSISKGSFSPVKEMDTDIQKAVFYIGSNYADQISLEDTADTVGLNPAYFSSKFHAVMGMTFKEYLNSIRIRTAAQMLSVTDDSVTKIALNCGFSSSNYFKDRFKKQMGCSPREFRKRSTFGGTVIKHDMP